MTTDRLAAELAGIRERASQLTDDGQPNRVVHGRPRRAVHGHDAERLADAAEALLTQAARWDDEAAALDKRAEGEHPAAAAVLMSARAQALTDLAGEVRGVIAAKLLGEGGTSVDQELLAEAETLLGDMWKRLLAVKPWLDKPYPDCPESSPWAHGIGRRARYAHDLSLKIRKHLKDTTP